MARVKKALNGGNLERAIAVCRDVQAPFSRVVYSGLEERLPFLKELIPEHVIEMHNSPHVEIYRVADIPSAFFDE